MIEISLINEKKESLFYGYKDVMQIWICHRLDFYYKSKKIYGQHRLHIGYIVIWWGMFYKEEN